MTRIFAQQINEQTDLLVLNDYSKFKFGCSDANQRMAQCLASHLWEHYQYVFLSNQCVIIPSPYNCLPNAASMLTAQVINILNRKLCTISDHVIETSLIHRKVNYTLDYGFMEQKEREKLIGNDDFYINTSFTKDKVLIFIDDIYVTGAHERRLQQLLVDEKISNEVMFAYYGEYTGINEKFEGKLNKLCFEHTSHKSLFVDMAKQNGKVIVRVVKELLSLDNDEFLDIVETIKSVNGTYLQQIYDGAIGEKYHLIPKYQENFKLLTTMYEWRGNV